MQIFNITLLCSSQLEDYLLFVFSRGTIGHSAFLHVFCIPDWTEVLFYQELRVTCTQLFQNKTIIVKMLIFLLFNF